MLQYPTGPRSAHARPIHGSVAAPLATRLTTAVAAVVATLWPTTASAQDWPQWRGPARDGVSPATGLLSEWPDAGPPLVWRAAGLGTGFSSVAVAEGRVYTLGDRDGRQWVVALSEANGAELWRAEIGPHWVDQYGGPRGTPTVDGDRVYAIGTDGDLVCLDTATGRERWRRHLEQDFGGWMAEGNRVNWRRAESPLVDGDRLLVTPGAPEATIVALDKLDGSEIWRSATPDIGSLGADGAAYASIVVSEAAGVRQYVQMVGRGAIGVAADDGRFLWGYNRIANHVANIPTPVVAGDRVFVTTGYGIGAALLGLEADGAGGVTARELWFRDGNELQNHHGGVVLRDDVLYTGTGHNRGYPIAVALEEGEALWGPIRNAGGGSAAISYADGHLYFRYQSGIMLLVEARPDRYVEKGSFPIPDAAAFSWAHPVIANGRLYLREQDQLLAYDIRADTHTDP